MNYAVEQRLRFIDCMLAYYGRVGRNELTDFFGIGEATATRDFLLYKEAAPDNLIYSLSEKTYVRGDGFLRVYS